MDPFAYCRKEEPIVDADPYSKTIHNSTSLRTGRNAPSQRMSWDG